MAKYYYLIIICIISISCFYSCGRPKNPSYNLIEDKGEWLVIKDSIKRYKNGNYLFRVYELDSLHTVQDLDPYGGGPEIHVPSFRICKGTLYAKDWRRVYYGMGCVGLTLKREKDNQNVKTFATLGWIIPDCSPHTFKYIGDGYAIDHENMYLNGKKIPWDNDIINDYAK